MPINHDIKQPSISPLFSSGHSQAGKCYFQKTPIIPGESYIFSSRKIKKTSKTPCLIFGTIPVPAYWPLPHPFIQGINQNAESKICPRKTNRSQIQDPSQYQQKLVSFLVRNESKQTLKCYKKENFHAANPRNDARLVEKSDGI
jgi:hypothetical protein